MELPKDPFMLFSLINMKLRDEYANLDELCEDMQLDKKQIIDTLAKAGFEYDCDTNKFR